MNSNLAPLIKHGILLDKFATLLTDSYRASSLEMCGYDTSIVEFIDMSHTPKNVLIRAIKSNGKPSEQKKWSMLL